MDLAALRLTYRAENHLILREFNQLDDHIPRCIAEFVGPDGHHDCLPSDWNRCACIRLAAVIVQYGLEQDDVTKPEKFLTSLYGPRYPSQIPSKALELWLHLQQRAKNADVAMTEVRRFMNNHTITRVDRKSLVEKTVRLFLSDPTQREAAKNFILAGGVISVAEATEILGALPEVPISPPTVSTTTTATPTASVVSASAVKTESATVSPPVSTPAVERPRPTATTVKPVSSVPSELPRAATEAPPQSRPPRQKQRERPPSPSALVRGAAPPGEESLRTPVLSGLAGLAVAILIVVLYRSRGRLQATLRDLFDALRDLFQMSGVATLTDGRRWLM